MEAIALTPGNSLTHPLEVHLNARYLVRRVKAKISGLPRLATYMILGALCTLTQVGLGLGLAGLGINQSLAAGGALLATTVLNTRLNHTFTFGKAGSTPLALHVFSLVMMLISLGLTMAGAWLLTTLNLDAYVQVSAALLSSSLGIVRFVGMRVLSRLAG